MIGESIFEASSREYILNYIKNADNQVRLDTNAKIFQLLEKRIIDQLRAKLVRDLGAETASKVMERIAPINYYRKVIDKLSTIYQYNVIRRVVNGNQNDKELLSWYERELSINDKMNTNNEFYNAYSYSLLHFMLKNPEGLLLKRSPFCRTIPNHEFLVMNVDNVDPSAADIYIIFMNPIKIGSDLVDVYHVYTDTEFMVMSGKGEVLQSEMARLEQDGVNPYGTVPFVYANNSENLVMPMLQDDDFEMSLLVPLLLTDLNYATKFQSFSTIITIDADDEKLKLNPDTIINIKTDEGSDNASIQTLKPTVDIDKVLQLCSSQISLWLTGKGIRPGAIGTLNADSFASGVSKMIDESDTYESRVKQIEKYRTVEKNLWDKLLKVYHPRWAADGAIDNTDIFSSDAEVITIFPKPRPMQTRMELLQELGEGISLKLESRRGAMKALYPDWDDFEIDEKLAEIDADRTFNAMFEVANGEEQDGNEDNSQGARDLNT